VLATSIAETSLTIDGVRLVVDSGLSRRPHYDRGSGLTRLATGRATQATIAQRAGRAGRQGPGTVWRLWEAGETRARPAYDPPAILDADLAPLLLDLAAFGVTAPETLRWLDPPPPAAVADARARASAMGALDRDGRLSAHGRRLARLPLPPDLGHMLLEAARRGAADTGARLALLVQERGLGGRSSDMAERLAQFAADRSPRSTQARALAGRWAEQAQRLVEDPSPGPVDPATLLALAFPGRVARRRGAVAKDGARYLMANGSGAIVDPADPLARAEWLVVADAGGSGADARLRLGAAFSAEAAAAWCAARADREVRVGPDPASGRWRAEQVERLGAIPLGRTPAAAAPQAVADALAAEVRRSGLGGLSWPAAEQALRQRAVFARAHGLDIAALDDDALLARLDDWLVPRLAGADRLADIALDGAMAALVGRDGLHRLDRFAPAIFATPAGTRHVIGYDGSQAEVEVRVQALFGLGTHPMLADGRVPVTLALTSPAGRILQKTRDLPAFWRGSWADVRREMKGRYPKHPWPEDPAAASPTVRTKAAARTSG
jgi:ATP-dependent helicase HrpB